MAQTTTQIDRAKRAQIINRIKYRDVQAWACEPVPESGFQGPMLLCWDCSGHEDHGDDTPLTYSELCALYVAEGAEDFPVCDGCGKDLSAPKQENWR